MAVLSSINSPERGVILLDNNFRITRANRRASDIFGIAVEDMIGGYLPESVPHRQMHDDEVVEEVLDSAIGWDRTFHRYSAPVYSADGAVAGRVEIYSDITTRRRLEQEILERNDELAELNSQLQEAQEQLLASERLRALGEMAAGVAHDINNVLGIILGNAQLAKRKLSSESPAMRSIDAIELAARDAAETVRRLREIGKPVDNSAYSQVNLNSIVEDVVSTAIPAWKASGNVSNVCISTHLCDECSIKGNAAELREALANILLNSAQAMGDSGSIDILTRSKGSFVELIINDNGAGMDEETRKRIFDPFFTTRGAEGSGLGMSMVDAIAIRHRAKVIVDSEEGRGTAVTIKFPASKKELD